MFGALAGISGQSPGALTEEKLLANILVIISPGGGGGLHAHLLHKRLISYASWGPRVWPPLRSSAQDLTIKAVRGTVAIKGFFVN